MPDYGHELAFGTFLTPRSERPGDVVELAQMTERAGLQLATFQDHPYQPAFLDTWTLLSWIAAQTQTLRVATNVLNLPLRPPAVVARAVASLDRMSGGRVELGIGAGGFWDAIEAMGGRRLTPGQGVDALSEAIDVIRGIWDVTGSSVRVDGDHYRVAGAKPGPETAHDVSIWVGAYKPRMLALTGRKADGWLPSLAYTSLDALGPQNRAIDDAAVAAGREPQDIRRLLNIEGAFKPARGGFLDGPPEQWVQQLLPLVIEHGFSTFLLATDDPETIEVYGHDVAPALREAAAKARSSGSPTVGSVEATTRGLGALSRRMPEIDYDALPVALTAAAIEPGDRAYAAARSTYSRRGTPGLVLRPGSVEDVVAALAFARRQLVPLSVRSGGHGISGRSTNDGGIVVDVGRLNGIDVIDRPSSRVRLGPGARWGDVALALAPHGLAMSSGDYGDVGVGGLATAGGIGLLARKHGLTIDHVVAAEIVLADGSVVRADAEHEPDLLWAIRGAGGNFGIVTAVELEAYEVGHVVLSRMAFDGTDAAELLERWGALLEAAPRELTSFLTAFAQGGRRSVIHLQSVFAGDDVAAATEALTPMLSLGPLLDQHAQVVPYHAVVPVHGGTHHGGALPRMRSGLLDHVTPRVAERLAASLRDSEAPMVQLRSVGGAVNDMDPLATAYAHRTQSFSLNAAGDDRLDPLWEDLVADLHGLYLSFETDERAERLNEAFPGDTLLRLRELKARYDPQGVFNQNFSIPPAAATEPDRRHQAA